MADLATLFPGCAEEERLADLILKGAVVQKDKPVNYEFYAIEEGGDVVQ